MIDKKIFTKLRKELEQKDVLRENLIINSRPIMKESKQAIYALHKNSVSEARKSVDSAKKALSVLNEIVKKNPTLDVGAYNAAVQEYCEAATYYYFVKEDRLIGNDELSIDGENYLLGICDLTGELARRAVFSVVNEDYNEVKKIQDFVGVIHDEFLEFELRNGEIRRKSDSIKWNLKKIEEIMYDLKIRGKI
jgi:predicted translin family RNA/ssDNA-binding protein